MRNVLRNKEKIRKALGNDILERILQSVKDYNASGIEAEKKLINGDKREVIMISDSGHSCNLIAFYVISELYDVRVLAFKEFIG